MKNKNINRKVLIKIVGLASVLTACSGGGNSSPRGANNGNTKTQIDVYGLKRVDNQELVKYNGKIRDINGLVSLDYNITDLEDSQNNLTPSSSCYLKNSTGQFTLPCENLDLNNYGEKKLEFLINATNSYGPSDPVENKVFYDIALNNIPTITTVPKSISCNTGDILTNSNIISQSGITATDVEGDSLIYSSSLGDNYTCDIQGNLGFISVPVTYSVSDNNKTTTVDSNLYVCDGTTYTKDGNGNCI